jgi:hypothetical protein
MATANLNVNLGTLEVIDKRRDPLSAASPISAATATAAQSQATVDAALAVQNAGYWTQARLDATCWTDKLYALRMGSADAAGVS